MSGLGLDADGSIWVQDGARLRALHFSPEGDFIKALDFGEVGWRGANWSVRSGVHYLLGTGGGAGPSNRGVFRTKDPLVRLDETGVADTVLSETDHVIGVMTDELGRASVQRWEILNS